MGQRNMLYTGPMNDSEMDQQGQGHLHPEPCILYGNVTNFPQPNMHVILPTQGNRSNFDAHHLPDHPGSLSYGMYNGIQHHHLAGNLDLPVAAPSNHYNMYMATPPSGTRVFPVPLSHHGSHDQFQISRNHNEFSLDSYGSNNHFVDSVGGTFKRKNAEGIPGNFQYCYASGGPSSSSVCPVNLESDVSLMDGASFSILEYGVGGEVSSSILEAGPQRSVRNRSGGAVGIVESSLPHNPSLMIQGNHMGQPFHQMPGAPWLNQQFSSNGSDIGTLSWNQAPALPYIHGSINGGCLEAANMNIQGYQVTPSNRSNTTFLRPPSIPQGHPNLHHPPPPMHAIRGHNIDFHPQVASSSSRRLPTNSTSHSMNNFQDGTGAGPRFVGPVPPSGLRIYRPHRRDLMLEATPRQSNLPQLRVLPEDGVAILEFSGYHGGEESTDHHRDMRLDIDHMSYEELLALGEHIGNVGTGLSEDIIARHLKRKTFVSSTSHLKPEQTACGDQELNFCVICQNEYKDQEKIGVLDCEHEYHDDCIKKWLIEKNTCPICKSPALNTDRKELYVEG
ncbi:hypothetical protein LguiA_035484 [Lonicera macranthoides]